MRNGYAYTAEELAETYECSVCGKTIGALEADRNLVGDWAHCGDCWAALMADYGRYMRWDWLRRPWRRLLSWAGRYVHMPWGKEDSPW